jgi:ABC-type transport system involved in cytochrome c biogenesis permease subunit
LLDLEASGAPRRYMDIRKRMGAMAGLVQPLMGMNGEGHGSRDPSTWSATELAAFQLFNRFTNWSQHYRDFPIPMFPPAKREREEWLSPWGLVSMPNSEPEVKSAVSDLDAMARSFQSGDAAGFEKSVAAVNSFLQKRQAGWVEPSRVRWELLYNALDPFYQSKILFGFAILASLLGLMLRRGWMVWPGVALLSLGVLVSGAGIGLRMAIAGRAPISNLFETFIFVAWAGALLGLALEFFHRRGLGVLVGALTGFSMLMLSSRYNTDGDTIGVLVAVLNSNFWLSTHVVTISLGYAGMCLAGVLGHLYLIQAMANPRAEEKMRSLIRMTYAILAFGLIFSFIGTVLGGVWADQSWGRFWGWDPKENGALMIVLWGAILFHALAGRMIGPLGMAVGSVLGIIVVMMAWFGINLLGVGLHSYGFTSGVATALSAYVAIEVAFVAAAVYWIKWRPLGKGHAPAT